ncbi:TetR/AcrR family transcriptional regulator [Actinomycetospora endophytica]|uniref:TetR/AcrR family transcriptional regulator n=1 Tax=Actinomycetospora endophytica TaxID=2291215 RepID=A0ABS8PA58_9PSEU|nr:TetR/AcrR family transcriptional regulator [Actinomycetospora endophytica]MCD2195108.1 TetR/AcrR family transcriptional regulator [Actinomycetospora endophytica]
MAKAGTKGVSRAEREEQILGVAFEEFGLRGHAQVSVAEVARRADISKPLIYSYFGSRDGLASACVRRAGDLLVAGVAAARVDADAGRRALDTFAAIFAVLDDCRHAWSVLYDPTIPRGSDVHALARSYRADLAAMGAEGAADVLRRAGNADPLDHDLLARVWAQSVSAVVTWWLEHPDLAADAMVARCARVLVAMGNPI